MGNTKSYKHNISPALECATVKELIREELSPTVRSTRRSVQSLTMYSDRGGDEVKVYCAQARHSSPFPCLSASVVDSPHKLCKSLNTPNQWGMTPLHLACELGHADMVHILLHLGVRVNQTTSCNHGNTTSLVIAASGGHTNCVKLLLQFGANVNLTDTWGNTALFKAACYNFADCVQELLKSNANPNKVNKWGALPLQYASLQGHTQVVSLLLEHGADVQMWGELNVPQALTAAAIRGQYQCVGLLVKAGAPVNIPGDTEGHTPLEALIVHHFLVTWEPYNIQCVKILLSNGAIITPSTLSILNRSINFHRLSRWDGTFLETLLCAIPATKALEPELWALFKHLSQSSYHNSQQYLDLILDLGTNASVQGIRDQVQNDTRVTLSTAAINDLKQRVMNPRPLTDLSRIAIRAKLGYSVNVKIDDLPVPDRIKDYLKMASDILQY